ncbi:MAG: hypothetical protein ICV66_01545, partial [Chitinophagaceae bacterium]|nr:hypothetical protein [Chitinophagaceae bacterium]
MNRSHFFERIRNWELWPFWVRYLPIAPVWLWYCIRAKSFWFFTASNPTLTFGGFEGESKKEMYAQLPTGSYPKTIYILPQQSFEFLLLQLQQNKFDYPFVAKPDVGMSGILFRVIENEQQLKYYHENIPVEYLIQEKLTFPVEYSVFYYRYPNQQKGHITGFLKKEPLQVIGDGKKNLLELIIGHPKAKHRLAELEARHKSSLRQVIPVGEKYFLSHAANLNRGGSFINLADQIDDKLINVFDELSYYTKSFFYGRWDFKGASVEDIKQKTKFSILEFNGSGAEPNHVYNTGYSYIGALSEFVKHWRVLYKISTYNHKHGISYWPFLKGWR